MYTGILRQKVETTYREIEKVQVARDGWESILLVTKESWAFEQSLERWESSEDMWRVGEGHFKGSGRGKKSKTNFNTKWGKGHQRSLCPLIYHCEEKPRKLRSWCGGLGGAARGPWAWMQIRSQPSGVRFREIQRNINRKCLNLVLSHTQGWWGVKLWSLSHRSGQGTRKSLRQNRAKRKCSRSWDCWLWRRTITDPYLSRKLCQWDGDQLFSSATKVKEGKGYNCSRSNCS